MFKRKETDSISLGVISPIWRSALVAASLAVASMQLTLPAAEVVGTQRKASPHDNPLAQLSPDLIEKLRAEGESHGRPPNRWATFAWPQKRRVLFEQFGPTEIEKHFVREAAPLEAPVTPQRQRRLLVFYQCQYPHTSIATANYAYQQLGERSGAFEAVLSDDPNDIRPENLADFDGLLLNNTTTFEKTVGPEGQKAILEFVRGGKGLIGVHAAADSCKNWPEGSRLLNGVFQCHPWLPTGTWAFQIDDPENPVNETFDSRGFWLRDEVYVYRGGSHVPSQSHHLIALDLTKPENHKSPHLREELQQMTAAAPHRPVAWIHSFGKGRVFYSNLGHNNTTYWHPLVLRHYLAGIQFALGDLDANPEPAQSEIPDAAAPAPAAPL